MIEYRVASPIQDQGRHYAFSYQDARKSYQHFCSLSDEDFLADLPAALHLACFICFIKEVPTWECLSDQGIVHELAHLIQHGPTGSSSGLAAVREQFKTVLELA